MCINQSAFQKLKRSTVDVFCCFYLFFLKPAWIYKSVSLLLMSSSTLFMTTTKREAGGVYVCVCICVCEGGGSWGGGGGGVGDS